MVYPPWFHLFELSSTSAWLLLKVFWLLPFWIQLSLFEILEWTSHLPSIQVLWLVFELLVLLLHELAYPPQYLLLAWQTPCIVFLVLDQDRLLPSDPFHTILWVHHHSHLHQTLGFQTHACSSLLDGKWNCHHSIHQTRLFLLY